MKKTLSNVLAGIAYFDTAVACYATYRGWSDPALILMMSALCLIVGSYAFEAQAEEDTDGEG